MSSVEVEQWIVDARRGSAAAFERLYRKFVDRIYGLCLRMTANTSDAEDCVQNTFVKAWGQLDRFRGRSDFGTWLHRIAINEALMAKRRGGARTYEPTALATADPSSPDPALALDLEAAIAALPDQGRHVFVLRALYGHSHDEVAELLGIAAGTARAHFFSARMTLINTLRLEDDDDRSGR